MNKRELLMAAALGAGVVAAAPAWAQGVAEHRTQRFRELDANRDGVVTPAELNDHPGNFRALDRNGDGLIDLDEYVNRSWSPVPGGPVAVPPEPAPAAPPAPTTPADTFAAWDRNGNGVLTRGEWQGDVLTFARLDRNDDNRVTRAEYLNPAAVDTRESAFVSHDLDRDGWITRREWRGQAWGFDEVDRNGDNRISLREYLNPPPTSTAVAGFRDLDYDGNGMLTVDEWTGNRSSFNRLDLNADGRVSAWEFRQSPAVRPVSRTSFSTHDRNRDGYIEDYEWPGSSVEFRRLDRDRDGRLSRLEYSM